MREAEERMIFQNAVDRRLSGLQENPFLAQRIMNAEKGEIKVKKKLSRLLCRLHRAMTKRIIPMKNWRS